MLSCERSKLRDTKLTGILQILSLRIFVFQSTYNVLFMQLLTGSFTKRCNMMLKRKFSAFNFKFINICRGFIVTRNQKMTFVSISFNVIISKPSKQVAGAFLCLLVRLNCCYLREGYHHQHNSQYCNH